MQETAGLRPILGHGRTRMPLPPPGVQHARTNSKAVWSLASGICGVFMLLAAIPALILGYRAKQEIRSTGQYGHDLATVGIVLGWVDIGLGVAFVSWSMLLHHG